jgi:hypothetical protein
LSARGSRVLRDRSVTGHARLRGKRSVSNCIGGRDRSNNSDCCDRQQQHRYAPDTGRTRSKATPYPVSHNAASNMGSPSNLEQQRRPSEEAAQLFCDPDAPVDDVPECRLWRPCFVCCEVVGSVAGVGGGLTAGALCKGDGAGVSPVWANADCKVIMRVIRDMHVNVFVTVTSRMTTIGRMNVRPWLQVRERRGVHPQ